MFLMESAGHTLFLYHIHTWIHRGHCCETKGVVLPFSWFGFVWRVHELQQTHLDVKEAAFKIIRIFEKIIMEFMFSLSFPSGQLLENLNVPCSEP